MLELRRRGFSLVELLVTLTLSGFVASTLIAFVVTQQRVNQANRDRFDRAATLRDAATFLPSELRELNSADSAESDILSLSGSSLRYKAMRSVRFICRPPDTTSLSVTTEAEWIGLRDVDPAIDSLLLFAGGDITRTDDDAWLHADVLSSVSSTCPSGIPGRTLRLAGVSAADLLHVFVGAPVRAYALMEIRAYGDARGQWWVGLARYQKARARWATIQPLLGPIAPGGLTLTAYDRADAPVQSRGDAASIGIRVQPLRGSGRGYGASWLLPEIRVALRNTR